MNELALFAGAGGGILGSHLLGWKTVCAVEWADYPRRVLLARQRDGILPKFPIWDDVQTFDGKQWRGRVDIVTGGFPCQDISSAGNGAGIEGEKSGMWKHMARIIGEVRPKYAFMENSPMLTSRGLGRVLGDLAEMGYDAKWGVLGAKTIGAFHERERIWIFAFNSNGNRIQKEQYKLSVLETKNAHKVYARNIARTIGLDGVRGMVDSYVQRNRNVMAFDVDRFKAVGNGQVPGVASLAFRILSEGVA